MTPPRVVGLGVRARALDVAQHQQGVDRAPVVADPVVIGGR